MMKKEIQEQIDDSVRIFKETLEAIYLKDNVDFYGIGVHSLTSILMGSVNLQRKINGNYRISGELSKDMIKSSCGGLPRELKDWTIFPLVITLFNENIGVKETLKEKNEK